MSVVLRYRYSFAAALALGLSFCFAPDALPGFEICQFKRWTGLPCPGCGLTHSLCSISHGQFARAWGENPFGYLFYALALLLVLWPLLVRAFPRLRTSPHTARALAILPPVLVGAMLIFGAARIIGAVGW